MRKHPIKKGHIYHVFTKSIAGYRIFRTRKEYKRFIETLKFYRYIKPPTRFSEYLSIKDKDKFYKKYLSGRDFIVDIIAYCLMPTHVHLLLVPHEDNGISHFMKIVLDSYTRYFNLKNNRKGPLWQSRFKNVLIETEEQLMHVTRYIHLNPVTEHIVENPEDWMYSSYLEYLGKAREGICQYTKYFEIIPEYYQDFVNNQKDYQRALKTCTYDVQVFGD